MVVGIYINEHVEKVECDISCESTDFYLCDMDLVSNTFIMTSKSLLIGIEFFFNLFFFSKATISNTVSYFEVVGRNYKIQLYQAIRYICKLIIR